MASSNILVNPTPFDVEFPYHRGLSIRVPGDSQIQVDNSVFTELQPNQAGYEEIRNQYEPFALFLLDPHKSYDAQAAEAIKKCIRYKTQQLEAFKESVTAGYISQGRNFDDASLERVMERAGYGQSKPNGISYQIEILQKRLDLFEGKVQVEKKTASRPQYDPRRTCFVGSPREFQSETALQAFLQEQTAEFRDEHEKLQRAMLEDDTNQ